MLSFEMRECKGCDGVGELIHLLDKRISVLTSYIYYNKVFGNSQKADDRLLKDLIYYKFIITKVAMNSKLLPFSYKQIASNIKTLT